MGCSNSKTDPNLALKRALIENQFVWILFDNITEITFNNVVNAMEMISLKENDTLFAIGDYEICKC